MKILFLTLKTFSATGGIEKVCRVAGRAMYENSLSFRGEFAMYSMHDPQNANTQPYIPSNIFKGFNGDKARFIHKGFQAGIKSSLVMLSHINLLLPGYLIKLFSPKTKVVVVAHGIEAWTPLSSFKRKMLKTIDLIIPVSDFTKEKMKYVFGIPEKKFITVNTCLDPFLPPPADESRKSECRSSYGIADTEILMMTLHRPADAEKKNYDKVLIALKKLHTSFPSLKYLLVGKYEDSEKERLDSLVHDLGVEDDVIFTGFVPDGVMADYYNMADVYILPGNTDIPGTAFIEALYYGKPVISTGPCNETASMFEKVNSTQAVLNGNENIVSSFLKIIPDAKLLIPDAGLLEGKFNYAAYKNKLGKILDDHVISWKQV